MKFLGGTTEAHYVDNSLYLTELALKNPILHLLQFHRAVAVSGKLVSVDFAERRPGREFRLHAGRQVHRLQPVQYLLAGGPVVRTPDEVALEVAQPEQRA